MKHSSPHHMPLRHPANSIDDMDALLNHIEGFTRQVLAQHNNPSQQLVEEWPCSNSMCSGSRRN